MLAGEVRGEGHPVLLLHGLTATRRYVVMGSRTLERSGHRVLAYDARGHGRSCPAADGLYDYPSLITDLASVMDAAGFERATLAGASMGAHTAVGFALAHPERVAGLCLITPAFDPSSAGRGRSSRVGTVSPRACARAASMASSPPMTSRACRRRSARRSRRSCASDWAPICTPTPSPTPCRACPAQSPSRRSGSWPRSPHRRLSWPAATSSTRAIRWRSVKPGPERSGAPV